MAEEDALSAAWRQQARWSKTAGKLKADLVFWRKLILGSLISAAVLAALAGHLDSNAQIEFALALVAAGVVVVSPFVRSLRLSKTAFLDWTRVRSASEALKQEVYSFLTGTGDYRNADVREARLSERVADIVESVADLEHIAVSLDVPDRPVPEPLTVREYLDARPLSQVERYYRPKAQELAKRDRTLKRLEWAFAVAAAIAVGAAAMSGWNAAAAWVGVITTVSGAALAHREAERLEYLAVSYSTTANRLGSVRAKWLEAMAKGPLSPHEEDTLVTECEDAISVENQAWMATWTEAPRGV